MIFHDLYVSIWILKSMHMNDLDEHQMYEAQLIYPLGGAWDESQLLPGSGTYHL